MKPSNYYDRYNHFLQTDLSQISSFRTIKEWLRGSKTILDIGCGTGHLTNYWKATGIDNDKEAIEIAKKRFPKTKYLLGDATQKISLAENSVDAVICYNVLEHLTGQERASLYRQVKRILKKNGRFIAGYIDEDYWLNRILAKLFKNYGLNDPTHKVSWKIPDFKNAIEKDFTFVDQKYTSPYGKLVFVAKYFKGELIIKTKL